MDFKALTRSLLFRVIVAIILGALCALFFPDWLARVFITFNGLFGNFLSFFVPVLIFALIVPAIAGLGKGGGKWLGLTTGLAYLSTIISGFLAYAVASGLYPWLLSGEELATNIGDVEEGALEPFFTVEMPPPLEIMSALLLAFCVGLGMTVVKSETLYHASKELEGIMMKVINVFVLPLLPIFIFGMILSLGMNGDMLETFRLFGAVLILAVIMTFAYLLFQFLTAGAIAKRNPFTAMKNMAPAYATALGTSSSAATIPVTYRATLKNDVDPHVAGLTVPLCATIHLSGSMMKIALFAFAIATMAGIEVSPALAVGFILMLGITMIAAPGVPGGAIMAAAGLLSSMLGFTDDQVALMIAAYIVIDSFGTAANVTGDGALAMIVNRFAHGKIAAQPCDKDDELLS